jgi:hypothetical protein
MMTDPGGAPVLSSIEIVTLTGISNPAFYVSDCGLRSRFFELGQSDAWGAIAVGFNQLTRTFTTSDNPIQLR